MKSVVVILVCALLAACGHKGELKRPAAAASPPDYTVFYRR